MIITAVIIIIAIAVSRYPLEITTGLESWWFPDVCMDTGSCTCHARLDHSGLPLCFCLVPVWPLLLLPRHVLLPSAYIYNIN